MSGTAQTTILAALVADSLALGVHWVYDTAAIADRYGRVRTFLRPELAPYHRGKEAGDLTHYGDQMLLLLRHVAGVGTFDVEAFGAQWREVMRSYSGYMDQASTQTLANLEQGRPALLSGSASTDLSGAARMAPLLAVFSGGPELVRASRLQAQLTHNSPPVLAVAEILATASLLVMDGMAPDLALEQAARESSDFSVPDLVRRGLAARSQNSMDAVKSFGQSCAIQASLPGAVQIVARHGDDLRCALEENVMAGGDSAARGMFIATLLGARPDALIPTEWVESLRCRGEVQALLAALHAPGR